MGNTLHHTFIGIDAGARTGLAVWDARHETITQLRREPRRLRCSPICDG